MYYIRSIWAAWRAGRSSVHLRPGTVYLVRALLTAAYRSCLWSISACIVTSHHRQHIQATAVWPHGYNFKLNIQSKSCPGLLQAWFRRSTDENMNVRMDVEDLLDGLWRGTIVFDLHAGDRVVSIPKWHLLQVNCDWKATFTIHPMKV